METYSATGLAKKIGVDRKQISRIREAKLITPDTKDAKGNPAYSEAMIERIQKINRYKKTHGGKLPKNDEQLNAFEADAETGMPIQAVDTAEDCSNEPLQNSAEAVSEVGEFELPIEAPAQELMIDEEFQNLIPPLSEEEFKQLEENILRDGIQDPIKIWQGVIIDGHNRHKIAKTHGLKFQTMEMQFATRDDVVIWIIKNQFGRRNLTPYERACLALQLKPVIAAKAKENQGERNDLSQNFLQKSAESSKPLDTRKEIAKLAGVSHDTVSKVEKIEELATPEVKARLKSGELSINSAYNRIKKQSAREDTSPKVGGEYVAVLPTEKNQKTVAELNQPEPEFPAALVFVADENSVAAIEKFLGRTKFFKVGNWRAFELNEDKSFQRHCAESFAKKGIKAKIYTGANYEDND